jgi:menaquinone-dependent protoporphyrinogen oxidase
MEEMKNKILVAYATKYGSTQEVAENVATRLRAHELEVDLQPARYAGTLSPYQAVVLGAPLYIGRWHKDAQRFLSQHQQALIRLPVALFTLGPTRIEEEDWQGVRAQIDQELAKVSWLKPVMMELFGGRYDPLKLRFPDSLLAKLPASPLYQAPASDLRDWNAIQFWADSLVSIFQPVSGTKGDST